jgi:hypothetical protein
MKPNTAVGKTGIQVENRGYLKSEFGQGLMNDKHTPYNESAVSLS